MTKPSHKIYEKPLKLKDSKAIIEAQTEAEDDTDSDDFVVELLPLPEEEITPEILAAYERCRKLPRSAFVNL